MRIMCPACGQCYSGQEENCGNGCWRKEGTDGPVYNAGRSEGRADVCAVLRAILDPDDKHHWNIDGVIEEVRRLARDHK
jgi:alpha-D-ribose 1-methylphosphonate 5-triphosphate synthase subunit PhnG